MTSGPHFIVGMPRSGTTWLGRMLDTHPDIAVFGETDFWGRSYVMPDAAGLYDRERLQRVEKIQRRKDWALTSGDENGPLPLLPDGTYGQISSACVESFAAPVSPAEAFLAIAHAVAEHALKPVVVEKTPGHLIFLDRFVRQFPKSRIIAVQREPYGFITSLRHERDRFHTAPVAAIIRLTRHPLICALIWRAYMRALGEASRHVGDRLLVVPYEDIIVKPVDVLARVQAHLGVPVKNLGKEIDRVNSSFVEQARPTPDAATVFWAGLVTGRNIGGSRQSMESRIKGFVVVLLSCLLLPISLSLMVVSLVRQAAQPSDYILSFLGLRRADMADSP